MLWRAQGAEELPEVTQILKKSVYSDHVDM
jgi:hypothetical protein